MDRTARVVGAEAQVVREQFRRNRVGLLFGEGSFVDEHTVSIARRGRHQAGHRRQHHHRRAAPTRRARRTCSSTTRRDRLRRAAAPAPPAAAQHDGRRRGRDRRRVRVDVRPPRHEGHRGRPAPARADLPRRRDRRGAAVHPAPQQRDLPPPGEGRGRDVADGEAVTRLASGKKIRSETVLYATGRQGATESLDLGRPGSRRTSAAASRSTTSYRTKVPHIFAVGDVRRRLRARRDGDGAGPPRGAARVRTRRCRRCPSCCRPASTRSPRSRWWGAPRRT